MLKNFFVNAIRSMRKNRGHLALNITGLTIGLSSFFLISLYVMNELSFDKFNRNFKNTYRIKITGMFSGSTLDQAITAAPMAAALLKDYPEVENAVRLRRSGAWLVKYGDISFNEDNILFADSSFFKVFDLKLKRGNPNTALTDPRSIVITEKYAAKYFGIEDPIGKRISLEADTNMYTVTGVIQNVPSNSHFRFDMLASLNSLGGTMNQEWTSHNYYTYIVLKDGISKDYFESKLPEIVIKYVGPQLKKILGITIEDFQKAGNQFTYVLEPLKDIHLKGATQYQLEQSGSLSNVYIFSVIAVLILVIAVINYINLATAKSAARAREVGIRKVSGSHKSGLIIQFIGESVLTVAVASVLAIVIVLAFLPFFNQMTGKELSINILSGSAIISGIVILILLVGTAAGAYPAFVLASFNPVSVLRGTMNPGSVSKTLRGILVVFQFAVSIIIIIGSFAVYRQLRFMTSSSMGFDRENLMVVRRPDFAGNRIESLKEQLLTLPGVAGCGNSGAIPGKEFSNNGFLLDNDPTKATYLINETMVSHGFAECMGIRLAEGRFISKEFNDTLSVLINESAVKYLALSDPVGKYLLQPAPGGKFDRLQIIGIMKDFNIESLHKRITPVCFRLMPGNYEGYLCIRLKGNDINGTIRSIETLWKDFSGNKPFDYTFFDEDFNRVYEAEFKAGKLFILFAVLAISIACLGLIGLITYMTTIRTKEIGIRKTFGSTGVTIVSLFSKEVMGLIFLSSLIAYPVAWFGIRIWLGTFAEKTTVGLPVYVLASILVLMTGLLSILYHAVRAAGLNPAESLRYK